MNAVSTFRPNRAIDAEFPVAYQPLFRPSRYKAMHSGRGAGKSWASARALLLKAVEKKLRILCCREFQLSIVESVHKLLSDQIAALGLGNFFTIQQQSIFAQNGSEFIFSGVANNPSKIKSLEAINVAWIEEAQRLSAQSLEILIPTIRAKNSELWFSFNPDLDSDPVYRQFVLNRPPDCITIKTGWEENPWFPEELRREKDYLARVDPDAHAHVWGGECRRNSDAQVFRGKYRIEAFEPITEGPDAWNGPFYGSDFGFASSPTTLVKCWIAGAEYGKTQGKLMIEHEAYQVGADIVDTPRLFDTVPGARQHLIYGDCARPETINHLKNAGFRILGCEKWKGSIEDGISYLRSFERIVVHPRCVHTLQELRLYSYKVDRLSGIVLPQVLDRDNHIIDAVRYALQDLCMSRSSLGVWSQLGKG